MFLATGISFEKISNSSSPSKLFIRVSESYSLERGFRTILICYEQKTKGVVIECNDMTCEWSLYNWNKSITFELKHFWMVTIVDWESL